MPVTLQNALDHYRAGRIAEAEKAYQTILSAEPRNSTALHLWGLLRANQGDWNAAAELISRSLVIDSRSPEAYVHFGMVLRALGRTADALANFDSAIALKPDFVDALAGRGDALLALNRPAEAIVALDGALALNPDLVPALYGRGYALLLTARPDEALAALDRTIALKPDFPDAHCSRGIALAALKRWEEAAAAYAQALALNPNHWQAFSARHGILLDLGRFEECLSDCDRLAADPANRDVADLHRGLTLVTMGRWGQALDVLNHLIASNPNIPQAFAIRSIAHRNLGNFNDALADGNRAIALDPDHPMAHCSRGSALLELSRLDEALDSLNRALVLDPNNIPALLVRGLTLRLVGRLEEALTDFDRILAIRPYLGRVAGDRFFVAALLCRWRDRTAETDDIARRIREGQSLEPLQCVVDTDDPEAQLRAAKLYAAPAAPERPKPARQHRERLRIAYLSADFRDHPTGRQTAELFERHDRSRFETFGFCLKSGEDSPLRQRLKKAFDHFLELGTQSDEKIAEALVDAGIDIAVDMSGYILHGRTRVLASRPAPVAVNYFGYPGTLGASYIDYILADPYVIPTGSESSYTERVVRLPDCYFPTDTVRGEPPVISREEAGLPQAGFVFACFNNSYKFTPDMFDIWMHLLREVDDSVLWMFAERAETRENLCAEAEARGVAPHRLIFAERVTHEQNLARQRLADLFLDTLPYNAHTTASDALWMGVPLVTCSGRSFAARVAGSMLTALGMEELIAGNLSEYEALALGLARSPERLAAVREKLARNRAQTPLFDTERLCRHIEDAYTIMWDRHQGGAEPKGFLVPARPR